MNFGVSFPLFSKVDVNGADAHPLFKFLTSTKPGLLGSEGIKWNFTKFLIGKDGSVIDRYAPNDQARRPGQGHREGPGGVSCAVPAQAGVRGL